jgi:hypothetical protein
MCNMIERIAHARRLAERLGRNPIVGMLDPRQVGKTTLAGQLVASWEGPIHRFDLQLPSDLARLQEPELPSPPLEGLVILDKIQRVPEIFPVLRVLVDRTDNATTFLVLGSASGNLLRQSSETLAGRIAYLDLVPLCGDEVGVDGLDELWNRGGFPRSFLAGSDDKSYDWRTDFIRTFLERDLPQLGVTVPSATMHRFWTMLAHSHGTGWNAAALASAFGVSAHVVRTYVDSLTSTLVVRQLQPWYENVKKRQVKSPKVYIADTGLLHGLLGLPDLDAVLSHPVAGYSWESLMINEIAASLRAAPHDLYFWRTHAGAELDLFVQHRGHRLGFEIKRTTAPGTTKSLRSAIETLRLDHSYVVHAGTYSFPLDKHITAVASASLGDVLRDDMR